jgi:hypothetical protein
MRRAACGLAVTKLNKSVACNNLKKAGRQGYDAASVIGALGSLLTKFSLKESLGGSFLEDPHLDLSTVQS